MSAAVYECGCGTKIVCGQSERWAASERATYERLVLAHIADCNVRADTPTPAEPAAEPAMKRIGVVNDAGGGVVQVAVDRDLDNYPDVWTPVFIAAGAAGSGIPSPGDVCPLCSGRCWVPNHKDFVTAGILSSMTCPRCGGTGRCPTCETERWVSYPGLVCSDPWHGVRADTDQATP
jgi:hypothetical protein